MLLSWNAIVIKECINETDIAGCLTKPIQKNPLITLLQAKKMLPEI